MALRVLALSALTVIFGVFAVPSPLKASSFAAEVFYAVDLDGHIQIACTDKKTGAVDWRLRRCQMEQLNPGEFSRFYHEAAEKEFDRFELIRVNSDGSQVRKRGYFDYEHGFSRKSVNLWRRSARRTALLTYGENAIQYKLFMGRESVVEEGEFVTTVVKARPRSCEARIYHNPTPYECDDMAKACRRYFRDENYCRYNY